MRRRDFIALLCGASLVPFGVHAQQVRQTQLIGVLQDLAENEPIAQSEVAAFRESLSKLGWTDGNNVRIVVGWAAGNPDRIRELAKELVDLTPDAIVARGTPATVALARETHTIPVVFAVVADPIGAGVAESLAHPGGNVTGFSNLFTILAAKWVELLKEIAPHTQHVALFVQSKNTGSTPIFHALNSDRRVRLLRVRPPSSSLPRHRMP
jgi:putative ABC transport system substrate-binding protein